VAFKRCPIGTKGPKVCQENIPHPITPPPPACTVVTRHDGSMFSFFLCQILTLPSECLNRNQDSSGNIFPVFNCPILVSSCKLQPLFPICSGDEWYHVHGVFCCYSPSASRLCVLWLHKCFAGYLGCNEWLFQSKLLFCSSKQLESVGPFSSDL